MPDPSMPPGDRSVSPADPRVTAESRAGSLRRRLMLSSVLPPGVVAVAGAVAATLVQDGHLDRADQGVVFGGMALLGTVAAGIAGARASAEARAVGKHWAELSRAADRNRA